MAFSATVKTDKLFVSTTGQTANAMDAEKLVAMLADVPDGNPYVLLADVRNSNGLGLALVRHLIDKCKGQKFRGLDGVVVLTAAGIFFTMAAALVQAALQACHCKVPLLMTSNEAEANSKAEELVKIIAERRSDVRGARSNAHMNRHHADTEEENMRPDPLACKERVPEDEMELDIPREGLQLRLPDVKKVHLKQSRSPSRPNRSTPEELWQAALQHLLDRATQYGVGMRGGGTEKQHGGGRNADAVTQAYAKQRYQKIFGREAALALYSTARRKHLER